MRLLVVIPAYNEEESIRRVVAELRRTMPEANPLVIDDCSTDRTLQFCRMDRIPVVSLPVNLGIGGVVQTGYFYALHHGYDIAVQMDGDGQHDPAMLSRLLAPILSGSADMTIGSRFLEDSSVPRDGKAFRSTRLRRVGIRFFERWIRLLSGVRITDPTSGFRACNRSAMLLFTRDYAKDYPEPEAVMTAIRNGFRVSEVPVAMRERQGGISSIRSVKTAYYMLKVSLAILICRIKPLSVRLESGSAEQEEA